MQSLFLLFLFCAISAKENLRQNVGSDMKVNGPLQIPKTNELTKNENSRVAKDCIITLLHIQRMPLLTTNCCLTRLCFNRNTTVLKQMLHNHPTILKLFYNLCGERFYLWQKRSSGCTFENNLNTKVNKDTNFMDVLCDKEKSTLANCSENFHTPTTNGETEEINSGITSDSKQEQTERSIIRTLDSFTSISYVQAPNSGTKDKKIRFENITKISPRISGLQFLDVPKGDEMRIHNLRLEEEYLLFEVFSSLMGYLQLSEFPTELVRDALQKQVPFYLLAFQLLKMEIAVIGWILMWTIITVCIPFVTITCLCFGKNNIQRLNEDHSDVSLSFRDRWRGRTLQFLFNFLLLLALIPIILILIGNEQISKQMSRSVNTINIIFDDLNTFVRNTHMQISFVATAATDITIEAIRDDLEDIEELLARPYQEELEMETKINIAFDELDDLKSATGEVTLLVNNLLNDCKLANAAGNLLQEQLREISRQVTIARQQCRIKDRALCYTLDYVGLDVTFLCGNLSNDLMIKQLERIQIEKNFNKSIENTRVTFAELPRKIVEDTAPHIAEINNVLTRKRTEIYKSTYALFELSRTLSNSLTSTQEDAVKVAEIVSKWDLWRWLTVLGISTILSLVWILLLCGAPCGHGITSRTMPFLLSGITFASLLCLVVGSLGTLAFLLGSHGQSLLCEPLYDYPHYKALAEILNSGGILYKEDGIFKALLKPNDSLKIESVLKSCQRNEPAYTTFHLHNLFDAKSVTNYKTWDDFKASINNFTIGENNVEILSPSLQLNLQVLSTISTVNLTKHRRKISEPLTKRDLNSFSDQLNTVARHLTDPTSSKRIDNLALMVRKIIQNEMVNLNDLRNRILYEITALDVLVHPLNNQANQSLAQLKTIQIFLDNRACQIAEKNVRQFTSRLENYLEDLYNFISDKVTKEIGKCKPLWEIFHSTRFYFCKLIVDPMNGISASSFSLILLLLGIIPVAFKLVEHYKELNDELLTSVSHRRARDGLIIDDEGTWATPSSETPGGDEVHINGPNEQQEWIAPNSRQSAQPLIPSPPRMPQIPSTSKMLSPKRLSTIASRISTAMIPQIPSISRARSPKRGRHESLRLIEPICWKSGLLSSGSWL